MSSKDLVIDIDKFNSKLANEAGIVRSMDLAKSMTSKYLENLEECIKRGVKLRTADFFIIVLRKCEPLLPHIVRSIFIHRKTCPTPNYDQVVYHYNIKEGILDLLWVVPTRNACFTLKNNALDKYEENKELLQYVLDFDDGTLMERMRILNGEKQFSLELEPEKLKSLK